MVALQAVQHQWKIRVDQSLQLRQDRDEIRRSSDKIVEVCQSHLLLLVPCSCSVLCHTAYNQLIAMQTVRQQLERKMSQLKCLESQQAECNSQHKVSQTFCEAFCTLLAQDTAGQLSALPPSPVLAHEDSLPSASALALAIGQRYIIQSLSSAFLANCVVML